MGRFTGAEHARPSEGGVWVLPGIYDVEILKCKAGTSRANLDFFVAELKILTSDNPQRRPGGVMSWMCTIKVDTPALGDIRAFVAEAEGADIDEVGEEEIEYACSDANPLEGAKMHLVATTIQLKKTGKDFTKVKWELIEGAVKAA